MSGINNESTKYYKCKVLLKIVNGFFLILFVIAIAASVGNEVYLRKFDKNIAKTLTWIDEVELAGISDQERSSWKQDLIQLKADLKRCHWHWNYIHNRQAVVIEQMTVFSLLALRDNKLTENEYQQWKEIVNEYRKTRWPN